MFERMEIAEQVYDRQTPSKKRLRSDSNHDSHVRKRKGVESASPANPKKSRAGKRKTKNAFSMSNKTTSAYKPCFLRGPVDSLDECKVLK